MTIMPNDKLTIKERIAKLETDIAWLKKDSVIKYIILIITLIGIWMNLAK